MPSILYRTHFSVRWQRKPETDLQYVDNPSLRFDSLQHYRNYLTQHSDVSIVCRQPVYHYTAPLLGGSKTNVMQPAGITIPVLLQ